MGIEQDQGPTQSLEELAIVEAEPVPGTGGQVFRVGDETVTILNSMSMMFAKRSGGLVPSDVKVADTTLGSEGVICDGVFYRTPQEEEIIDAA